MNEIDRDVGLALLKRLWQRELIPEEVFISAGNSRLFEEKRFAHEAAADTVCPGGKDGRQDDN